jgi:hypothetical protein
MSGATLINARDGFQVEFELRVVNGSVQRPKILLKRYSMLDYSKH